MNDTPGSPSPSRRPAAQKGAPPAAEAEATQASFADAAKATAAQEAAPPAPVDPQPAQDSPQDEAPPPPGESAEEREKRVEEHAKKVAGGYGLTDVEYAVLLKTTCKGAPREIAAWFMLFCKHRKLDPFSKQVYLYNDKQDGTGQWNVVTGIDGLRTIASRSPFYRGQRKPIWTYEKGAEGPLYFDGSESKYKKIRGKRRVEQCEVTVRRAIPQAPADPLLYVDFFGIARFDEFVKTNYDGLIIGNWEVQPEHQLRIRAEAMALRMGFPEEVGGIYLEDEIRDRADSPLAIEGGTEVVVKDQVDADIEEVAKELGYTKARLMLEQRRVGGKQQLLAALLKELEARAAAEPKGGPRGAAVDPPAEEVPEGVLVPDAEAPPAPTGALIVALLRCRACGAKHNEPHESGCPVDETSEPLGADG
jgi:phage recombination protein Bet